MALGPRTLLKQVHHGGVYLLLHNENIRDVIDTVSKKAVLILGRFTPKKRKDILDAIRNWLRNHEYVPILFDFEKSPGDISTRR